MVKRANKRAQQEVGIGTMLMLILGLVALVVVIIGFTSGWDFLTKWFGDVDVDTTVIEQSCNTYITLGSGYCTNAIDIGKNSYVSCDYAKTTLGAKFEEPEKIPTCEGDSAKQICQRLKLKQGTDYNPEKIKVNSVTCKSLGVE